MALLARMLILLVVLQSSAGFRMRGKSVQGLRTTSTELRGTSELVSSKSTVSALADAVKTASDASHMRANFAKCKISSHEKCRLARMHGPTIVYPGGGTKCLSNEDYAFLVIPGDADKLLFNFDEGGACWDSLTYNVGTCSKQLLMPKLTGVLDRSNSKNPMRRHTVVFLPYCSGDVFVGDARRRFWSFFSGGRHQTGYKNTMAALKWTKANIGATRRMLSNFVIMGQSAGAMATQAWAGHLLKTLRHKTGSVIVDSFAGLAPARSLERVARDMGVCRRSIWKKIISPWCSGVGDFFGYWLKPWDRARGPMQAIFIDAIKKFPQVQFGIIQAKRDAVQILFYNALLYTMTPITGHIPFMGDGPEIGITWLSRTRHKMWQLAYLNTSNIAAFVTDSSSHVYSRSELLYTTGSNRDGQSRLTSWMKSIVTRRSRITRSRAIPSQCSNHAQAKLKRLKNKALVECFYSR